MAMRRLRFLICLVVLLSGCFRDNQVKEVRGVVRIGHEVRSFVDARNDKEYWLIDKSGNLIKEYQKITKTEILKYQPVEAQLKIRDFGKTQEGFAADYEGVYEVKKIIGLSAK